jgi:hypothetical protein
MAVFALSLTLAVPGMVSGAGANIANPGNIKFSMGVAVLTPSFRLSHVSTKAAATATIQSNGTFVIPRAALAFQPVDMNIGPPHPSIGPVAVQLVAMSDFIGAVNPSTHVESLAGRFEMVWSQIVSLTKPMAGCPIGPFDVHLTTKSAGARPYESTVGTARMVDGNFAIDALTPGTSGCAGLESSVNSTLSLPITTTTTTASTASTSTTTTTSTTPPGTTVLANIPVPAIVVSMRLTPAPRAPQPPATTTTAARTTTSNATSTSAPAHAPTTTRAPKPTNHKKPLRKHPTPHHRKHHKKHRISHHKRHHPKLHKKPRNVQHPSARRAATALARHSK